MKRFNTVLEGTYHDDINRSYIKLIKLEMPIPLNVTSIYDSVSKYLLVGAHNKGIESRLDYLGTHEGVVLPTRASSPVMEMIRAIYLADSRLFILKSYLNSKVHTPYRKFILKFVRNIDETIRNYQNL